MNIILIGYMASGKSTVGLCLAKKINFSFIDLDQYIEKKENMAISDIFLSRGEIYFRKIETKYLEELLSSKLNTVISLGGGTPCYGNNMNMIVNTEEATSIYLKATLKTLVERLIKEKDERPLIAHLNTEDELLEFVGKHLFERSNFYSQAKKTVNIDTKDIEEVVEEIIIGLF